MHHRGQLSPLSGVEELPEGDVFSWKNRTV